MRCRISKYVSKLKIFIRKRFSIAEAVWVKISQIRTLYVERLKRKIGKTSPEELHQIIEGFNEIIWSERSDHEA